MMEVGAGGRAGRGVGSDQESLMWSLELTRQAVSSRGGTGGPRDQLCVLERARRQQFGGGLEHGEPGGRGRQEQDLESAVGS